MLLSTLITCTVSAIVIAASAAAAATTLAESVQTAHAVDTLLTNTTQEMIQQTRTDQEILARLSAVESAVIWLGEWQDALVTGKQLTWDPGLSKLCHSPEVELQSAFMGGGPILLVRGLFLQSPRTNRSIPA